jgi:cation diffusion facilitator family transporter
MNREQHDSSAWSGIVSDIVLALFKGTIGLGFNSLTLLSGALYSVSDALAAVAEKLKLKAPSKQMLRYHTKEAMDPLIAVIFCSMFIVGGLGMIMTAVTTIMGEEIEAPGYIAGLAVVLSIALKEVVFQYQYRKQKQNKQNMQKYIENHRYSLYTSIFVLLGVFGSMLGQATDIFALLYLDALAAIVVACLLFWRAYRLLVTAIYVPELINESVENVMPLIETVQRVHGVILVDELIAQEQGHYIFVKVKISVNPRITVLEAQEIANRAKVLLLHRFSHISEVNVEIVPYALGYPYKSNHEDSDVDMPTLIQ